MFRLRCNQLARLFIQNSKNVIGTSRYFKTKQTRTASKYSCLIAVIITVGVFFGVITRHFKQKEEDFFERSLLHPPFAGGGVCNDFLCFGESLCFDKTKAKVKLNYSSAVVEKKWYSINGVLISKHGVKQNATFKTPFICPHGRCDVTTPKEIFDTTNYRSSLCQNLRRDENCNATETFLSWRRWKKLKRLEGRLESDVIKGISLPLMCATQRLADRIVRRVYDVNNYGSVLLRHQNDANKARLLLLCKVSPGTVVQKLFPSVEGWPFPRMIGTCGNVIVHTMAVEKTLYEVYNEPWKIRLDVAIQLLNLARHMTENDSKFSILLHKLTPHDVGVSERGRVRIHRAENVVIADQDRMEAGISKNDDKTVEVAYKNIISITEREACGVKTDINYYAVCRNLLGGDWNGKDGVLHGGLLHNPQELGIFNKKLSVLLDICIKGSLAFPREQRSTMPLVRTTAAWELRELLISVRECDARFAYRYPECELIHRSSDVYKMPSFELQWLQ